LPPDPQPVFDYLEKRFAPPSVDDRLRLDDEPKSDSTE
jgi:hypothetical protein